MRPPSGYRPLVVEVSTRPWDPVRATVAAAGTGRSVVLVVEAEPGAGKTTMVRELVAGLPDWRHLGAVGVETEADVPLAGLDQLLRPLAAHLDALPGPQQASVRTALGIAGGGPVDEFLLGAALVSLLAAASAEAPLLVTVDDAHCWDAPSASALGFAARRLTAEPVALVLTIREGEPFPAGQRLPRHRLRGLHEHEAAALLAGAGARVAPGLLRPLVAATGGNPLALLELRDALTAEQLAGRAPLPDPLPVAATAQRRFQRQLAALPPSTAVALGTIAADPSRLAAAATALAELGRTLADLDPAVDAGLLTIAEHHAEFTHPLARTAAYHTLSTSQRRQVHAALAAAHARLGDIERHALHLSVTAAPGDEVAAAALERAGEQVSARSGPGAAADVLTRAADLSPPGPDRARRQVKAAHALLARGEAEGVTRLAREVLRTSGDRVLRAGAATAATIAATWGASGNVDEWLREAQDLTDVDAATASGLVAHLSLAAGRELVGRVDALAARAHELAAASGDPAVRGVAAVFRRHSLLLLGMAEPQELVELDEHIRAADLHASAPNAWALPFAATQLLWLERYDECFALLERLASSTRSFVSVGPLSMVLGITADASWTTGRWLPAYGHASESVALARELGAPTLLGIGLGILARVEVGLGHERDARAHAAEALAISAATRFPPVAVYARHAVGLLELSRGRAELAVAELRAADDSFTSTGAVEPSAVPYLPDLGEALLRAGDVDGCAAVAKRLAALADQSGRRWVRAASQRLEAAALSGFGEADQLFLAALAGGEQAGRPFELARTHLVYGERLRRERLPRAARSHLRRALDVFEALPAPAWAERARHELAASGARVEPPQSTAVLTPVEQQVAMLVARGASNKEAAGALFISPRTVEHHLTAIYRKLGLRSRSQLAHHAASQGWQTGAAG